MIVRVMPQPSLIYSNVTRTSQNQYEDYRDYPVKEKLVLRVWR